MPQGFHAVWLLWAAVAVAALFAITQIVQYPGRIAWRLVKSAVLGLVFVLAVNWVGAYFHYHLALNAMTALTAGFLGIPGVAALIALHLWVFPA